MAIKKLYATIEQDERHSNAFVLSQDEIAERGFKNWSMAYYNPAPVIHNNVGELLFKLNFIALSHLVENPTEASKLFWFISKLLLKK